jgi:dual specificity phosphatase 12
MPTRSQSTLTGVPPADAIKADEDAVSDVYEQVSQTGSLAQAAKKLQQRAQAWEDDPEEQAYLEDQRNKQRGSQEKLPIQVDVQEDIPPPKLSLAQQRMMAAFAEEEGGDVEMDGNTISVFEQEEEEEEFEAPGVTHLQEIQEGLWIGDLVAAMDTAGLEERGIVSPPLSCLSVILTPRPTLYHYFDPDFRFHLSSTSTP